MNEKQKLVNLLAEKKEILAAMRKANEEENQTEFDDAQQKMKTLDEQIQRVEAVIKAVESVDSTLSGEVEKDVSQKAEDGTHAFCEGIRAKSRGDLIGFQEQAKLINELNGGTAEQGGLLVPVDIQTKINQLQRALNPLARFFNVENVRRESGSRVIDTAPTKGFTQVEEYARITKDDQPAFSKIEYKILKYALIVPVTEELLNDSDENLITYLTRWFAKKGVLTENKILLELLSSGLDSRAVQAAKGKELATIKTALNVTLDPAISLTSAFLTNQSGFNYLDMLEDKNGRPLLQPDPTSGTTKMLLARPVHVISDAILPNLTGGAPLYIGDFRQYGTLFRRKGLEITSTREGGDAWITDSTEVRGILRLGASVYDSGAATAVTLAAAESGS